MQAHADASHENKNRAIAANQLATQQSIQGASFNDQRIQTVSQKKLQEMVDGSEQIVRQDAIQAMANTVAQFKPVAVNVTGVTHLVKIQRRSIFRGEEVMEVSEGMNVIIETSDKYRSRRGPNQEAFHATDEMGEHQYRWFRVLQVGERPAAAGIYIRSGTFATEENLGAEPVVIEGERRERDPGAAPGLVVGGKLSEQDTREIMQTHRASDTENLSFCFGERVCNAFAVLEQIDNQQNTLGNLQLTGTLCISDDNSEVFLVTQQMVRDFWESNQVDEGNPNLGSFSTSKGYVRHAILGPDARYNCAAWAHGVWYWIEPENMSTILAAEYNWIRDYRTMETGQEYLIAWQKHFMRAWKMGENSYRISEKNGASGVYEKMVNTGEFVTLCKNFGEDGPQEREEGRRLYRKK